MSGFGSAASRETADYLASLRPERVEVKFCERFDGQSRIWNLERHSHNVFELLYFLDGGAKIHAGDGELSAGLFDLVLYPPGVVHEEQLVEGFRNEVFCFWLDLGPTATFHQGITVPDRTGEIRVLVEALFQEAIARRPLAAEMVALYVGGILTLARRWLEEPPKDDQGLVARCLSYIHEHYTEDFEVETMARAVAVSPSYLFRSFKKKLGMTPMHYRNEVRIEKSKLLLCQSNRRLDLIAQELGITDVKYFSSLFKQVTGQTPGAFRKLNRHSE
ncbi:MAG: AraC family transcriptional regulator [Spirochaetales bacterium]